MLTAASCLNNFILTLFANKIIRLLIIVLSWLNLNVRFIFTYFSNWACLRICCLSCRSFSFTCNTAFYAAINWYSWAKSKFKCQEWRYSIHDTKWPESTHKQIHFLHDVLIKTYYVVCQNNFCYIYVLPLIENFRLFLLKLTFISHNAIAICSKYWSFSF